jgi:hypothetical protein
MWNTLRLLHYEGFVSTARWGFGKRWSGANQPQEESRRQGDCMKSIDLLHDTPKNLLSAELRSIYNFNTDLMPIGIYIRALNEKPAATSHIR